MIDVKDFSSFSFVFAFEEANQMRDFFNELKEKSFFSRRTAAYNLCANQIPAKKMTILKQTEDGYVVEESGGLFASDRTYIVDPNGRISGKGSFGEHRQCTDSAIWLKFPNVLETLAKKHPDKTFYGMIHDTDFDWWETTITYEYKDGVLTIKCDGYSEDGPEASRKRDIVISVL